MLTFIYRQRTWVAAASAGAAMLLLFLAVRPIWQAGQAIHEAELSYNTEGNQPFTTRPLDQSSPPGVEWLQAPAAFHDGAFFDGDLYLAGSAGLFRYDENGELAARYLAGRELPAAPLTRLVTGIPPGGGEPVLYAATEGEGLLLFDGEQFRQVRPENPALRKVTAVLPVAGGRVLFGTQEEGVLTFDGKTLRPLHSSTSGFHVTALAGTESDLWVGTLDRGVLHLIGGAARQFGETGGLPDQQVLSIAAGPGAVFVGTPLGVAEFQSGEFTRKLAEGFFARNLLRQGDRLLIGTLDEGTFEIDLARRRPRSLRSGGRPLLAVQGRLFAESDSLYAVSGNGLYRRDPRAAAWRRIIAPEPAQLTDTNISALAVEPDGTLWVGYFDRGLDVIEPGGPTRHLESENLFCINRIVQHPKQNATAVATANGLVLFDARRRLRSVLGREDGLIANHVTDVLLHDEGMTVATPAGLTLVDGGGLRSVYAFHGLVNNHAYTLAEADDQLLVGTLGGLSMLRDGAVQASFTTANSDLRHNWITAAERVGTEWFIGTYGAGVVRQDSSGQWHSFPGLPRALEINPNALLVTAGYVYAGTLGEGLYIYDRATTRWNRHITGLPSMNVTALAAHDGFVYVGTDNGLVRMPEGGLVP